jgi:hypothetical protein
VSTIGVSKALKYLPELRLTIVCGTGVEMIVVGLVTVMLVVSVTV